MADRDGQIQIDLARRTFASRWALWWWVPRASRAPAGLWYALNDSTSIRLGRRRIFLFMWLPAVLAVVLVGAGSFVAVQYDVRVWYFDKSDPQRTPVRDVKEPDEHQLFALNIGLYDFWFGLFWPRPPTWEQVVERRSVGVVVRRPALTSFDPFTIVFGATPAILLVFGWLPACAIARIASRGPASRRRLPEQIESVKSSLSLVSAPVGVVMWLWVVMDIVYGCTSVWMPDNPFFSFVTFALLLTAIVQWMLLSVVAWPRLIGYERAGAIFKFKRIGPVLALMSLLGPFSAYAIAGLLL